MSDSNLSRSLHTKFVSVRDSGYTKICVMCGERHTVNEGLIGRERLLKIEDCSICKKKPRLYNKYDYAVVIRGGSV